MESVGPFFHSFDHNSLVSRPFSARKAPNRSSHHILQNGQGAVSSIQLSIWSMVRSNLGQTWSNLVKALQTLGNVSRTTFWGFLDMVDPSQVGNGSVKPRSNLGQPWSTLVKLWKTCPGSSSWGYLMWRAFVGACWLGSGCLVLRADTRENPVGKNGVMTWPTHLNQLF